MKYNCPICSEPIGDPVFLQAHLYTKHGNTACPGCVKLRTALQAIIKHQELLGVDEHLSTIVCIAKKALEG
jgi:hypothetical protein